MGKYKVDISGIKTNDLVSLSSKEMNELFIKYKSGDESSRESLINGNLRLVLSVLKKFYNKSDNLDDLFQIGCVGLIKAIDNFDLSYNVKFSTYAVPMILGEIKRYIRDNNSIRISRSLKDIAYKVLKFKEDYYLENGIEPSVDVISTSLDISDFDISNALLAFKDPISMYEAIYNDGGDTIYLYDQIEDKRGSIDLSNRLALENAIDNLEIREKYILDERFIIGKSQMEIARELSISQAQVSRLEKKAIKQLKKVLK
ncbi:MAG: sigma-70 family RNA polymerase sigma factor [Bacilli bacterium]|nr:sigma-70 family RNA polymerase sigma factor [Bacilli bacterium]